MGVFFLMLPMKQQLQFLVVFVKAIKCSDPDITLTIFDNGSDHLMSQPISVPRIVQILFKCFAGPVEKV